MFLKALLASPVWYDGQNPGLAVLFSQVLYRLYRPLAVAFLHFYYFSFQGYLSRSSPNKLAIKILFPHFW